MSGFKVSLTPEAQKDIKNLEPKLQVRILDRLEWIGQNAEFIRHQTLKGKEWQGCFKYRFGDYRIIYLLVTSDNNLIVLKIGHRREVYK